MSFKMIGKMTIGAIVGLCIAGAVSALVEMSNNDKDTLFLSCAVLGFLLGQRVFGLLFPPDRA